MFRRIRPQLALAVALALLVACAATTKQIEYRTLGVTVHAVDVGMQAFADRVVAGKTTPAQEARVRDAFQKYQDALKVVKASMGLTTADPTPEQLRAPAVALLQILSDFGIKVTP